MCHLVLGSYGMQRCSPWSHPTHSCLQVYPIGFGKGAAGLNGTGFQLLIIIFMELFGVTLGQLIASISPSVQASTFLINISSVLLTYCRSPFYSIRSPVLYWALSPAWPYLILNSQNSGEYGCTSSTLIHECFPPWCLRNYSTPYARVCLPTLTRPVSGLIIRCKSDEFSVFNPPTGQTCQNWSSEFISSFGGYLDNPTDTQACRYCQYSVRTRIHQSGLPDWDSMM